MRKLRKPEGMKNRNVENNVLTKKPTTRKRSIKKNPFNKIVRMAI